MQRLESIRLPEDLKKLSKKQLAALASQIREEIIDAVSSKAGHLGASLGVVELSIALHYFYDFPEDKLVWDVGHQAYPHKILTGRSLSNLRQLNGISGFLVRSESIYDDFGAGHSSTSISAALGMALASNLKNEKRKHIAVIGDASIASGMAFEALNHAGATTSDILIILNDNQIGIDPSVGALKKYLSDISARNNRLSNGKNIFELLNFHYYGPIDGHSFNALFTAFESLNKVKTPKILHILTKKGKGFKQAEQEQIIWHAPGKFDKETGERKSNKNKELPKFQDVFGKTLCELAEKNENIIGLTPAMPTGSGLNDMMKQFPSRAIDVGIAEQHIMTLAAGWATQGFMPFVAIYSTFLQRAYDQLIHDIALQKLPVVICIDRAGLVGEDGATHHGFFDISFLNAIPNLIVSASFDEIELRHLMFTAQSTKQPFAIRYPKGKIFNADWQQPFKTLKIGEAVYKKKGENICVLSTGTIGNTITSLKESFTHIHFPFIKPLDYKMLDKVFKQYKVIITYETGMINGGFGQQILYYAKQKNYTGKIFIKGYSDQFIKHGTVDELNRLAGLSPQQIREFIFTHSFS